MPSQLIDEEKLPEQRLPGGKEFSGRRGSSLNSLGISGVTAYQEKGNRGRCTFSVNKEDVKTGQ